MRRPGLGCRRDNTVTTNAPSNRSISSNRADQTSVSAAFGRIGQVARKVEGLTGDSDEAPGRALGSGDNVPSWFSEGGEVRLIVKTEGVGLYVRRRDSADGPLLGFGLGEGLPLSVEAPLEWWRERLAQRAVVILGNAPFAPRDFIDDRGRVPLLGVTTRDVKRVELRYSEGPPSVGDTGDGGFVLLADAWRPFRELIADDGSGHELGRSDIRGDDMRYLCEKEPGVCPPEASSSSR